MNATTLNSFPAMHSFRSPRGVALALIVLLHVAFFFALSSGLGKQLINPPGPDILVVDTIPDRPQRHAPPQLPDPGQEQTRIKHQMPYVPPIDIGGPSQTEFPPGIPLPGGPDTGIHDVVPDPVIRAPGDDPFHPLTSPAYPSSEIRANHSGTVVLRVQVLEDGRIGDVQLAQSSGYRRLDESALREARHWRMKPGTRDGVPVVMWKEVPITFELKDRGSTDL
jgi:periplasmic protein TonB